MWIIEQLGADGRWFIRGSERFERDAAHHAARYQQQEPNERIRYRRKLSTGTGV